MKPKICINYLRNNTRVLGFDNDHAVKKKGKRRKKYGGRIITWGHFHKFLKIAPYEFESESQLLDDFWKAVDEKRPYDKIPIECTIC